MLPSLRTPISTFITMARPCTIDSMFSVRFSVHRVGRPSAWAALPTTMYSGYTAAFGPKPPPTHGAVTRS